MHARIYYPSFIVCGRAARFRGGWGRRLNRSDRSRDLVDTLYETSVKPERLLALIEEWNACIVGDDPGAAIRGGEYCTEPFVRHVERALSILDELGALEFRRLDDLLAGMSTAAMILTDVGVVVAANEPARGAFGLYPGCSIDMMPIARPELGDFADRVATVASASRRIDDVVVLQPQGRAASVLVHLATLGAGDSQRYALAVSTEHVWSDAAGDVLARLFKLTPSETALAGALTAGQSIRDIARSTGRTEGTMRSQLHSVLLKTETRGQGELVRLAAALLQSTGLSRALRARDGPEPGAERQLRSIRLQDGRRLAVMRFGDPAGKPVIWLQSVMGLFWPSRSGERELIRRGMRIIVPIRAGFGTSDPAPPGRDILEVAVGDVRELIRQASLASFPVVAPDFSVRVAMMLAQAEPEKVERIVGVGCGFPILNLRHFRDLHAVGRVFVACARYAPHLLPFLVRASHMRMVRNGLAEQVNAMYRITPADARAFSCPDIAEAVIRGFTAITTADGKSQAAFCAELVACQRGWPRGLGDVACPVALVHGEQDGIAPHATAQDYAQAHRGWRCFSYRDEGQLVAFSRPDEVLDAIEGKLPIAGQTELLPAQQASPTAGHLERSAAACGPAGPLSTNSSTSLQRVWHTSWPSSGKPR